LEILNLGGAGDENIPPRLKSRKKTKLKIAAGIGSLAAITGLGSTLAASISLNSGQPVEFGQGVATTAACDADGITVTPTSEYVPSTESFRLSGVTLSGINTDTPDATTGIGCAGKTLIIRAYTDDSDYERFTVDSDVSSPLYFSFGDFYNQPNEYYNDGIAITFDSDGDVDSYWSSRVNNPGGDYVEDFYIDDLTSGDSGEFTIELNDWDSSNPGLDSRAVSKFTVESIDTPVGGLDTDDWYDNNWNS
jgi:hypothetical protein